jgi:hypothetical protein
MAKRKSEYDYQPCDRYVIINPDDPNLVPIKIDVFDLVKRVYREFNLPEPKDFPGFEDVEGYGLPPEEQMFHKEVIPERIVEFENSIKNQVSRSLAPLKRENTIINLFWETLNERQDEHKDIIEFIAKMWFYRLLGKFIMINGKMHYLPPDMWMYVNHYTLKGEIEPEYRDRDKRWYTFTTFCEHDTTTFKDVDPKTNKPIKNEQGDYDMIDLGYRVCYGANISKHRQAGDSSKVQGSHLNFITARIAEHSAIQGKDDENADNMFQWHCVYPYSKWPIYFKPLRDANEKMNPKNSMLFKGEDRETSLDSKITFAKSADAIKYDNEKIGRLHEDEPGKLERIDVCERHNVMKPTMARGAGRKIQGACKYVTTVELIDDPDSSNRYMKLCFDSMWEDRGTNGQTKSGMYNGFFRASDGLEGYIGKHGESIEGTPTPEQSLFIGSKIGARQYIEDTIKDFKKKKDFVGLASFKRKHPLFFKDNFSIALKNQFFNKEILETREQYLAFDARHLLPIRGNFVRRSWPDGDVDFIKDDDGRFYVSIDMIEMAHIFGSDYVTNKRYKDNNGIWTPDHPLTFIASADPFGLNRTEGRASMGGGAVRWRWDKTIDPKDKPISQWLSQRPVCTYSARPDLVKGIPDSYCEDMLMMTQYFNAMMYPERNVNCIQEYFEERKYHGYLLHDFDSNMNPKATPGWWHGGADNKRALDVFNHYKDDISKNASRWTHLDLLHECLSILDTKDMTNWDLFTAYGGCLLAEMNPFYNMMQESLDNKIDQDDFMAQFLS